MPLTTLVVDDVPFIVKTVSDFLGLHSCVRVVGSAGSGAEALRKAEELQPDVITVDLSMPDMSGLEVIPRLRGTLPDVVIIALTSLEDEKVRQAALKAGADDYVDKTQIVARLIPAILTAAGKRDKPDLPHPQPVLLQPAPYPL